MAYSNMNPYLSNIIHQLLFWVTLSKEHPLFIKKIAECNRIPLSAYRVHTMDQIYSNFQVLEVHLIGLDHHLNSLLEAPREHKSNPLEKLQKVLQNITSANIDFINILKYLEQDAETDKSWILFINHITLEQKQLLQKCSEFTIQIKEYTQ